MFAARRVVGAAVGIALASSLAIADPASAAPANNDRAGALGISSGQNLLGNNFDSRYEAGEFHGSSGACPYDYGTTNWYEFSAPAAGTLTVQVIADDSRYLSANDEEKYFDPTVAVFPGTSISAPIACNDDDPAGPGNDSGVDVHVTAGTYGLQVGGLAIDDPPYLYYDEGTYQILVKFAADPTPVDPLPPPPPPVTVVDASVSDLWRVYGSSPKVPAGKRNQSRIEKLKLRTEPGSTAEVACKGDCGGISKVKGDQLEVKGKSLDIEKLFGGNQLLVKGTKIQVFVRKAGEIGRYFSYETRADALPKTRKCKLQSSGEVTDCQG